jgi:hypothetical protein
VSRPAIGTRTDSRNYRRNAIIARVGTATPLAGTQVTAWIYVK